MDSSPEKNKILNSVYTQMFIIVVAFLIMGISSFFFVRYLVQGNLVKSSENALALFETEIINTLLEYEIFLSGYSETIRNMILKGENQNSISEYMITMTDYLLNDKEQMEYLSGTHGYFFTLGGTYISGKDGTITDDVDPWGLPCFNAAVAAEGKISVSELYTSLFTGKTILSFSRYVTDGNGDPLCVICIDIELEEFSRHTRNINITENSYGILLNKQLIVISHPQLFFKGLRLYQISGEISSLYSELEMGKDISGRRLKNYLLENSIVYFRKMKYDWYLGIVIPVNELYRNVYHMAAFLTIVGIILAAGLCVMFYYIYKEKKKADIKTQQKSNFLATISHEIRTPLNAILGMTEIQMQNTSHPPSTSEAFIKINNSGNLLLNIINDILDLSKIEVGRLELIPVKYEVASLINDIIQLNYIRYESKPIEFALEIDENIPSVLVGDELRIKQILNNLLSNAFKYTDKGKVTFSTNAECVGRGGAVLVTLVFQITDTGQGMTQDQVNKLFDEYTRFDMEANRTTEGAGLGMIITKNLVDLMYGKISIKSNIDEGTSVTVRLPQKTAGTGISGIIGREMSENLRQFRFGNAIQLKKSQFTPEYMPYGRILIVDDVEINLFVAKGLMAPYGLKIDLVTSGFEAIDKIKEGLSYDIIFMDHMMPKMDGIETTKMLREMGYSRPVVALTANAVAGQTDIFLRSGFDGFISKPIDIRQLNITLNRLIRDKQPSEVLEAAKKEKAELDKKQETNQGQQKVDSQLAGIFAKDAEKAVAVLETCMQNNLRDENDTHMYIINVHAMKSALANIGEKDLSAVAQRLEQAGRENDVNVMLTETHEFIDKLKKVIDENKSKDDEEDTVDTEESLAYLREKLTTIKEACEAFDKKSAKNTLSELREKTWSNDTKKILSSIAEHLLHSEFDNASALADEFLKK